MAVMSTNVISAFNFFFTTHLYNETGAGRIMGFSSKHMTLKKCEMVSVFTYAQVKWFYGQSERAYYLNYFIKHYTKLH